MSSSVDSVSGPDQSAEAEEEGDQRNAAGATTADEPPEGTGSGGERQWSRLVELWQAMRHPWSNRRRAAIVYAAAVAAVAALVTVGINGVVSDPLNDTALPLPPSQRDPVAPEPRLDDYPDHCGVALKTVRRLLTKASGPGGPGTAGCSWYDEDIQDEKGYLRNLYVTFDEADDSSIGQGAGGADVWVRQANGGLAMYRLDPEVSPGGDTPPRHEVTGLGDEAYFRYSPHGVEPVLLYRPPITGSHEWGASLVFRVGALNVATVFTSSNPALISEKRIQAVIFDVASEAAKALGAFHGKPRMLTESPAEPAVSLPKACQMVGPETIERVAKNASAKGDTTRLLTDSYNSLNFADASRVKTAGVKADACSWTASKRDGNTTVERHLRVAVAAAPSGRVARREYLRQHYIARDWKSCLHNSGAPSLSWWSPLCDLQDDPGEREMTRSNGNLQDFRVVPGLGDQAFAQASQHHLVRVEDDYERKPGPQTGQVLFRIRNLVVHVQYTGETQTTDTQTPVNDDLTSRTAMGGAYLAAQDIAKALRQ
jgi:hypothetical protein